jgi:hypothetical protein
MRTSPGLGRRVLICSLPVAVAVMVGVPTAAPAKTLGRPVAYPLRHDFSMAVGLPGHGKHEPTSCYDIHDEGGNYACRIVAGVEETGHKQNFFLSSDAVLEKGHEPTYGMTLVNKDGIQFEGCDPIDDWTWECDYASRMHVSGQHYKSSGYVWRVLWAWQKHTAGQVGCAGSLATMWTRLSAGGFLAVLAACQNGPMERP